MSDPRARQIAELEHQAELWALVYPALDVLDDAAHRVRFTELHAPIKAIAAALTAAEARPPASVAEAAPAFLALIRRWLEASEDEFFDRLYEAQADARTLLATLDAAPVAAAEARGPQLDAALAAELRAGASQVIFENHPEAFPGAVSRLLIRAAEALETRVPAPQEPPQESGSVELEAERLRSAALQDSIDGCAQRVAELAAKLTIEYQRGVREGLEQAATIAADCRAGLLDAHPFQSGAEQMRATIVGVLRQRSGLEYPYAEHNDDPTGPAGPPTDPASGPPRCASAPEGVK